MLERRVPAIELREAGASDAELLFRWRNLPEIIALGSSGRPVAWEEHRAWFARMIGDAEHLLRLIIDGEAPIGQIRFDRIAPATAEVSIYLLPGKTGKGIGVEALRRGSLEAFRALAVETIEASVREDNARSVAAFAHAGFVVVGDVSPGHIRLALHRPAPVPHNRLTVHATDTELVAATVASGHWAGGPRVVELEAALADVAKVPHVVCVASGSGALRLALRALGVGPHDLVLVPAYSCVAVANAALACGARIVPVDIERGCWNISSSAAATIQPRPAALVAVDTFGAPADVARLSAAVGVPVIEDCAHAFGLDTPEGALGGRTDVAITSFYATKLVGGGEGGAVLTRSAAVAEAVRRWRDYADAPMHAARRNERMNDLEASLALSQLRRLPELLRAREARAARYQERLSPWADVAGFHLPDFDGARVWYRYVVELDSPVRPIIGRLAEYGVVAAEPVTDWRLSSMPPAPVADRAYERLLSLPLYPTLTIEEQDRVIHALIAVCRSRRRSGDA